MFDFSNYSSDSKYDDWNKLVAGKMKDQTAGVVMGWSRPDLTGGTAFGGEKTGTQKNIFLWKTNLYLSQKDSYLHQS